jgi:hypothetical protein
MRTGKPIPDRHPARLATQPRMRVIPADRRRPSVVARIADLVRACPHSGVNVKKLDDVSPRARARITGAVYLLFFLTAIAGEVFNRRAGLAEIGTSGDAAATSDSILAHVASLRWGFALGLFSTACYVVVTALFYQLFRPVSRSLSFIAVCFSLMGLAIQTSGSVFLLSPLVVPGDNPSLSVFDAGQRSALVSIFLNLHTEAGYVGLVFDGLFLLLIGYLIFRSTFLPHVLGLPMALAAVGWLTFLAPPSANHLVPYIEVLGFLAEASFMLWLLVRGVNAQRWREQESGTRTRLGR